MIGVQAISAPHPISVQSSPDAGFQNLSAVMDVFAPSVGAGIGHDAADFGPHSTRRNYDSVITPHQFSSALDWPESCV